MDTWQLQIALEAELEALSPDEPLVVPESTEQLSALAWPGWKGPLLAASLLEPVAEVGPLTGEHLGLLTARDIGRLMLCTCHTLRARLVDVEDVKLGVLQHCRLGGSSALQVSARCRHGWQHQESTACVAARALRWLDAMERAVVFEDFRRSPSSSVRDDLFWGERNNRGLRWRVYGKLQHEGDRREVEDATAVHEGMAHNGWWEEGVGAARCLSLRICCRYTQCATHYGRGIQASLLPSDLRPAQLTCLFRVGLDLYGGREAGQRRPACNSSVGYLVLSDGAVGGESSHGLFGTEAAFMRVAISPSHRAQLIACHGEQDSRVVASDLRLSSWLQLSVSFDWGRQEAVVGVTDFAAASWPEADRRSCVSVRFRGPCPCLGQVSLLSVEDRGHATCSWTDLVVI